jgi:hypothetical protein
MALTKTTLGRATVWYDALYPARPYWLVGPDANLVIEEFVDLPLLAGGTPAACTTTLVGASTTALAAGNLGGALVVTTADSDNDGAQMQWLGEAFLPTSSNQIYFGIKLQISDATQSDFLVGLCITDTTVLGGMTDGLYFRKVDGATACTFVVETGSAETETAACTITAATDVILEFWWNGTALNFYVDGVLTGTPAITYIPTAEYLTPTIAFLTGDDAAITMTVSWMRAGQVLV